MSLKRESQLVSPNLDGILQHPAIIFPAFCEWSGILASGLCSHIAAFVTLPCSFQMYMSHYPNIELLYCKSILQEDLSQRHRLAPSMSLEQNESEHELLNKVIEQILGCTKVS